MDTRSKTLTWTLIVIVVLIVIGFLYFQTLPKKKATSDVIVVPSDILDESTVDTIASRPSFGAIPVTVSGDEAGRQDPFASY